MRFVCSVLVAVLQLTNKVSPMPGVRETLKNTFRNTFSRLLKRKRPSDAPQATAAVNDYAQDDEHHPVDDDHPGGHDDVVTDAETIDAYPVELATLRDSIRTSPPGTFGHLFKSVLRESVNDIGPDALLDLLHVLRKQLSCLSDEPALNIALGVVEAKRREVADPTGCAEVGVVAEVDMGKIQIPGEIAFDDTAFQTHYVAILNQARDFKKRKAAMDSATSTKKQRLGDRGEQKQVSTTVCPEQCCWVGLTDIEVQRQVRIRKPDRATRVAGYHPRSDMSLNAIVEYESFLTTSITSFTASKLVSERTAHQRKHFEQGLCQTLAYLSTSHEMKSGWLGALLQGVLFSRAISLTHDFIALELASEAISIPWLPLEPVHPRRTSMRLLNAPRTAARLYRSALRWRSCLTRTRHSLFDWHTTFRLLRVTASSSTCEPSSFTLTSLSSGLLAGLATPSASWSAPSTMWQFNGCLCTQVCWHCARRSTSRTPRTRRACVNPQATLQSLSSPTARRHLRRVSLQTTMTMTTTVPHPAEVAGEVHHRLPQGLVVQLVTRRALGRLSPVQVLRGAKILPQIVKMNDRTPAEARTWFSPACTVHLLLNGTMSPVQPMPPATRTTGAPSILMTRRRLKVKNGSVFAPRYSLWA